MFIIPCIPFLSFAAKKSDIKELTKHNITILKEINYLDNNFIKTKTGAKVYSPSMVKTINENIRIYNQNLALIKLIENNKKTKDYIYEDKYFYDLEMGKTNYTTIKENKVDEEAILKNIILLLENEDIPPSLLYNLKIFISPYSFDKVKGYSSIYWLEEAEDYIVIPYNKDYLEENLYHELGHIYWNNLLRKNKNFKVEYVALYKNHTFNDKIWEYNLEENFAEDFKIYMLKKKGLNKNKKTNIPYDNKVEQLIDRNEKYLKKKNELFFPNISIKTMSNKIMLNPKNYSLSEVYLPKETIVFDIVDNKKYTIQLKVCNNSRCYETNSTNLILDCSSNYYITIFYLSDNQKVEIGTIKMLFI